jgi:dihydroorotate dehydrogenase (NAD+) catalytic subunit
MQTKLPHYDWSQSYEWNYDHAPSPVEGDIPPVPGEWDFCGIPVDSPLGIPAGPLLNGRWCLYYASLGFDVLTYKTVRSRRHKCYDMPNLQPVDAKSLVEAGQQVTSSRVMDRSWAVSFGMPSMSPEHWRADIEWTRDRLPTNKLLAVSVVGTVEPEWTEDQLANDYAQCAKWAVDSGADIIETNFSCPNVSTCDGQLYQQPEAALRIAECVRERIGKIPYVIKIGHLPGDEQVARLARTLDGVANALAMTNSIAATVRDENGTLLFDGQARGICGEAIHSESVRQVGRFSQAIRQHGLRLEIIAVGGITSATDVSLYHRAGAHAFHLATAVMWHPSVGIEIRKELSAVSDRD